MRRSDRLYEPIGNPINPITKMPIYGDPTSIATAVIPTVIGGLMGGDTPEQQQAPGFTPYNITTGFGSATFDKANQSASYTLDPKMAAFRDQYYGAAQGAMPTENQTAYANQVRDYGQGLFTQASGMDTQQMTQDYYNKQQQILQPGRQQESSLLADTMFATGRSGLGVGMGQGYVNPQQYALQMAREDQNSKLMFGAEDRARGLQTDQLNRGNTLYGLGTQMATDPYTTANNLFGFGANIENLGKDALTIGANIGSMSGQVNNQAASYNNTANNAAYEMDQKRANGYGTAAGNAMGVFQDQGGWQGVKDWWNGAPAYSPQGQFRR
jgi:hypothetical protein